ncbi:MAG: M48 family metallopeptidase, partial [Prevotellaceae bacterium]|nr:M48 family metallopeptidase [Prevotellaceae bacterium]
ENPRVYNIVENLTMACGMPMPKVNVIDDPMLNAFASGIDEKTYTVTVTTGICERLTDAELAGVIGHELTHIRNRDTRLLIISIIFVGIMSTVMSLAIRLLWNNIMFGGTRRRSDDEREGNGAAGIVLLLVAIVLSAIGYFFTLLTRFAISRKREYMADAGGAELCGDPLALASALRKISAHPGLGQVEREDVAQLFIVHPKALRSSLAGMMDSLFSTHPSTEKRIAYLEQF